MSDDEARGWLRRVTRNLRVPAAAAPLSSLQVARVEVGAEVEQLAGRLAAAGARPVEVVAEVRVLLAERGMDRYGEA